LVYPLQADRIPPFVTAVSNQKHHNQSLGNDTFETF